MNYKIFFGENLEIFRKAIGASKKEMEEVLDVHSVNSYRNFVKGIVMVSSDKVYRLKKRWNEFNVNWFFTREGNPILTKEDIEKMSSENKKLKEEILKQEGAKEAYINMLEQLENRILKEKNKH